MTISRIPVPEGTGGGASGLSDVTGDSPVIVTTPSVGVRNVAFGNLPPTTATPLPAGATGNIGRRRIAWIAATTANVYTNGLTNDTAPTGFPTPTSPSYYHSTARMNFSTTAVANNSNGTVISGGDVFRGTVAGTCGFQLEGVFGFELHNTVNRFWCGYVGSTVRVLNGNVDPSAIVNCCGFGWDTADTNMQFMHNDASGTCTKVDLGANFPRPTVERDVYYFNIFCDQAGTEIDYYILRMDDSTKAVAGTATTNLPVNTQALYPQIVLNNAASAAISTFALMRMYQETTL